MAYKAKPARASSLLFKTLENLTLLVVCICCVGGVFLCGAVLLASLHDPVPIIILACLFAAGTMVSASELTKPLKKRPV
ncbi:MAG: hypothetical protein RIC29_05455 [Rhodospirillaceae bacterium]